MGVSIGSLEKGLFIYEDTSSALVEKKHVRFDINDLSIYKDKFTDLVGEGIFRENSSFEDHSWIGFGTDGYKTFDFSETEYNQKLYWSLKCFVILQLSNRRLIVNSVNQALKTILKTIRMTNTYDKRLLKEFIEFIELKDLETNHGTKFYKQPNLSYIYFCPINDSKHYIETLLKIDYSLGQGEVREIPTFSNFILFNEILNDYMSSATVECREKYFPVFIWWKLTSVIPIRPIEFIEILNEGIRYDLEEDAYFILIPRRKQQSNILDNKNVDIQHELKINKSMYSIISDFRQMANIKHEKYLFPISVYTKFLKREDISIRRRHYSEHISWKQMTMLLDDFFDKVVNSQYNIKVVKSRNELDRVNENKTIKIFNLGDTRHMSICMIMMQGFSELTIAQMAGHTDIRTQSHYSSHIDDFQRSYSGLLEKDLKQKMHLGDKSDFSSLTFRQKQLLSYSLIENSNARELSNGFCHSENFPNECFSKDCIFCNKFQLDISKISDSEISDIKDKTSKIQDEIQVKLNFIKRYYDNAFKKKKSDTNKNERDSINLERNAIDLNILLNRKAMMDVHLIKNKEIKVHDNSKK